MPESRPSAVSALTWPKSSNRWRISLPILSRTSARSPPVARWMHDGDDEEADVHRRDPIGQAAEGDLDRDAQVLLLEDAAELVGDRPLHLLGHQVEARGQAVPGAKRPADQLDGLGHRVEKLPDPPLLAVDEPEERSAFRGRPSRTGPGRPEA